jgi:tetratricopeptide (TPR) repeat protein
VFTGDIGPPYRRTYVAMGDTVNLAARIMAKAPFGRVYTSGGLLERSNTEFDASAIPPFMVKGKSRPVEAWELGPIRRRTAPGSVGRRLPLIGRDRELAKLRRAVTGARHGSGSLVEIVGETGSGKSRLLAEARDLAEGMRFMHATCEAYSRATPYVAWRDPLRQLLGLTWHHSQEVVIARLHAEVEGSQPDLLPWLPLLAIVLDADLPPTREVEQLAPSARVEKLHEVVLRFLEPALEVATLVEIEHAHLMDEASAALLHALARDLRSSAWLVLVTRRDVEQGFVADGSADSKLELEPLSRAELTELAESTPEAHEVAPHLLDLAVERAGGSPEFLLDLLAAAAGGSESLPESVDAAAMARIDALAPADRTLVRRAAVLGLSFHTSRLGDVLDEDMATPNDQTWARLSPVFAYDPDGHVRFKRPALREAAYEGLPFRTRRALHRRVAEGLEQGLGSDADAEPAVLSQHFMLAGDHRRAYSYALQGAERATARFAHADAAQLYRRAIEAGRQDAAAPADLASAFEQMAEALQLSGQLGAAHEAVAAARRLIGDDSVAQARLLLAHTVIARRAGRLTAAVRWGTRALRMLEGTRGSEAKAIRARLLGALSYVRQRQHRLAEAERLCRVAMAEAEAIGEVQTLAYASYILDLVLVAAGREHEATYSGRALEIYEQIGNVDQQGNVLNNLAMFAYFRWQWDEAIELYRRSAECCERAGKPADAASGECNIGEILSDRGRYEPAAACLHRAQRVWHATGQRASAAFAGTLLGRLAVRRGRYEEGVRLLTDARDELRRLGEGGYAEFAECLLAEAEAFGGDAAQGQRLAECLLDEGVRALPLLRRVRGVALARLGNFADAVAELERSVALAREDGAKYDLACALDLSEMLEGHESQRARERDAIVKELQIVHLPRPLLPALTPARSAVAV